MWRLRAWTMQQGDQVVVAFVAVSELARLPATRAFDSEEAARRWVEDEVAFVVVPALARLPATRAFDSEEAARRWVEDEARFLGAAVEWV